MRFSTQMERDYPMRKINRRKRWTGYDPRQLSLFPAVGVSMLSEFQEIKLKVLLAHEVKTKVEDNDIEANTTEEIGPYLTLMFAVLLQALADANAINNNKINKKRKKSRWEKHQIEKERREALAWLRSESEEIYSYNYLCDALSIPREKIRSLIGKTDNKKRLILGNIENIHLLMSDQDSPYQQLGSYQLKLPKRGSTYLNHPSKGFGS